jgi:hypothetical protein
MAEHSSQYEWTLLKLYLTYNCWLLLLVNFINENCATVGNLRTFLSTYFTRLKCLPLGIFTVFKIQTVASEEALEH